MKSREEVIALFRDKYAYLKTVYPSVGPFEESRLYQNPDGGWQMDLENWAAITLRTGDDKPHEIHGAICARWYKDGGAFDEVTTARFWQHVRPRNRPFGRRRASDRSGQTARNRDEVARPRRGRSAPRDHSRHRTHTERNGQAVPRRPGAEEFSSESSRAERVERGQGRGAGPRVLHVLHGYAERRGGSRGALARRLRPGLGNRHSLPGEGSDAVAGGSRAVSHSIFLWTSR